MGHGSIGELGPEDLVTTDPAIAERCGIARA